MSITYDAIQEAFLSKITEFEFLELPDDDRESIIDDYMKRAISEFRHVCDLDLSEYDDMLREILVDCSAGDADEIIQIVSEGMLVQWMKPYLYKQEILEQVINTRDYSTYSPAELLRRIGDAYDRVKKDYVHMVREYSYNHSDLTKLHL